MAKGALALAAKAEDRQRLTPLADAWSDEAADWLAQFKFPL